MIKGVIFDLDGTITDSMQIWDNILCEFCIAHKIKINPDVKETIRTMSLSQSTVYIKNICSVPLSAAEIKNEWENSSYRKYAYEIPAKPGALKTVKELYKKGIKMCVATSGFRKSTEAVLKRLGILNLFDFIITSDETGTNKSKPDIFLKAAEKLSLPNSSCLVIEDSAVAVETAKKEGFKICAVSDSLQTEENRSRLKNTADLFTDDMSIILNYLK